MHFPLLTLLFIQLTMNTAAYADSVADSMAIGNFSITAITLKKNVPVGKLEGADWGTTFFAGKASAKQIDFYTANNLPFCTLSSTGRDEPKNKYVSPADSSSPMRVRQVGAEINSIGNVNFIFSKGAAFDQLQCFFFGYPSKGGAALNFGDIRKALGDAVSIQAIPGGKAPGISGSIADDIYGANYGSADSMKAETSSKVIVNRVKAKVPSTQPTNTPPTNPSATKAIRVD